MKRTSISASLAVALFASGSLWAADAIVTGDVVLRAGPDPEYPSVADLREGTPVSVQGCVRNYSWCDVAAHGERGWVAGEFLVEDYQGRRVVIREYGVRIGIPVVSFTFGSYWDTHYRSRPFYVERTRYERVTPRLDVNVNVNATSTSKSTSGTAVTSGTTTSTTTGTATATERARIPATDSATTTTTATARTTDKATVRTEGAKRTTAEAGSAKEIEQDSSPQRAVKSDTTKPEPGQASAQRDDDKSAIEPEGERGRPAQARAKTDEPPGQAAREDKPKQQGKPERKDKDEKDDPDDKQ